VGSVVRRFYCLEMSPKGSSLERFPTLLKKRIIGLLTKYNHPTHLPNPTRPSGKRKVSMRSAVGFWPSNPTVNSQLAGVHLYNLTCLYVSTPFSDGHSLVSSFQLITYQKKKKSFQLIFLALMTPYLASATLVHA
jgi:hypothetical protein